MNRSTFHLVKKDKLKNVFKLKLKQKLCSFVRLIKIIEFCFGGSFNKKKMERPELLQAQTSFLTFSCYCIFLLLLFCTE